MTWSALVSRARAARALVVVGMLAAYAGFGLRHVAGVDTGVLANTAWMGRLGYSAYRDFLTGVPPLFIAGAKLAFVAEPSFRALVAFTALASAGTLLLHDHLLRRAGVAPAAGLAIATGTQALTLLPFTIWWYNPMTSLAVILLLTALLSLRPACERPVGPWVLGALVAATVLSKPNVGLPVALGAALVTAFVRDSRYLARAAASLGLSCVAVLAFIGASPADLLVNYGDWSSRLRDVGYLKVITWDNEPVVNRVTYALLLPVAGAALVLLRRLWPDRRRFGVELAAMVLALGATAGGVLTNNDFKMIDGACLVAIVASVGLLVEGVEAVRSPRTGLLARIVAVACVALVVQASVVTVLRSRVRAAGTDRFWQPGPTSLISSSGFFAGVHGGVRIEALHRNIGRLLELAGQTSDPSFRVFFGIRLDWAYAAFDLEPPRGFPLWWEAYEDPPASGPMVERFRAADIDMAVFLNKDLTFFPDELKQLLLSSWCAATAPDMTLFFKPRSDGSCP